MERLSFAFHLCRRYSPVSFSPLNHFDAVHFDVHVCLYEYVCVPSMFKLLCVYIKALLI